MSFHFSTGESDYSLKSDYVSLSVSPNHSKTLGSTGIKILNGSFPVINKKRELKKENETYAYLEKLKVLDITKNNIEHIHYLRHLELGDATFRLQEKQYFADLPVINEPRYKKNEEIKALMVFKTPAPPGNVCQCQIKIMNSIGLDRFAILIPFNLVLTLHQFNKKILKTLTLLDYKNQVVKLNKFGAFIEENEFFIASVEDSGLECANVCTSFKLNKLDVVFVLGVESKFDLLVADITQKYFTFNSVGQHMFTKGAAVFSAKWEIQGIYSHSLLNLHFVYRFEPILSVLLRNQREINSKQIDNLLMPYTNITKKGISNE